LLLTTILLITALFGSGYIIGHRDHARSTHTVIEPLLASVELVEPAVEMPPGSSHSPEIDQTFKPFWEAWDYVYTEYYDADALNAEKLSRGAMRGMLGSLGDTATVYLDPLHRELTEADLRGAFDGIGVNVEMTDDRLRVVSPLDGSPGARAGLRPGDIITHIDGRETTGMGLVGAIRLIRGPRGSSVTLTIRRETRPPFDVTVQRDEIRVQAVRGDVNADGVAHVRIASFSLRVGSELRQTLERLAESKPRGWVLDMRGNPGGYLEGAIAVASQFIDDRVVMYEQRRGGERSELRTRGRARATAGPMVILVDKGTASAAEIVAAALRDNGRATLVGEQTFGKGSVQAVHRLSDGSALRLTVARWLTPNGEPIQGTGLAPDIAFAPGLAADAALEQAVNLVRQWSVTADVAPAVTVGASETAAPVQGFEGPVPSNWHTDDEAPVSVLDSFERTAEATPGLA
jgi:carboxyl-terminal processing protease